MSFERKREAMDNDLKLFSTFVYLNNLLDSFFVKFETMHLSFESKRFIFHKLILVHFPFFDFSKVISNTLLLIQLTLNRCCQVFD